MFDFALIGRAAFRGAVIVGVLALMLVAIAIAREKLVLLEPAELLVVGLGWFGRGVLAGALLSTASVLMTRNSARSVRWMTVAVAGLLVMALLGIGASSPTQRWAGVGSGQSPTLPPVAADFKADVDRPNIVLITIDTLRADRLSLAGYARATSPWLDGFAAGGTVFHQAIAHSPATLRSMAALLTGLHPTALDSAFSQRGTSGAYLGSGVFTLAERLAVSGYNTAGFVTNGHLHRDNGFGQGFADYDDSSAMYGDDSKGRDRNIDDVLAVALPWISRAEPPFFLWIHVMDPHHPYEPKERAPWEVDDASFDAFASAYTKRSVEHYTKRLNDVASGREAFESGELAFLESRYDAEILQTDRGLARLQDALIESGFDDTNTLVAVTSDHGEEFMEHGRLLHAFTLFDEALRVPLVLRGPGIPAGLEIDTQVGLLDLTASLLTWAGADASGLAGTSLMPLFSGEGESRPVLSVRDDKYLAYRTPERKLIVSYIPYEDPSISWLPHDSLIAMSRIALAGERRNKIGLFHLDDDPGEQNDRLGSHATEARRLYSELRELTAQQPVPVVSTGPITPGVSDDTERTLRALGYLD